MGKVNRRGIDRRKVRLNSEPAIGGESARVGFAANPARRDFSGRRAFAPVD